MDFQSRILGLPSDFWVSGARISGFLGFWNQNLQLLLDLLINLSISRPEFTEIYRNLLGFLEFLKTENREIFLCSFLIKNIFWFFTFFRNEIYGMCINCQNSPPFHDLSTKQDGVSINLSKKVPEI